jgi:hypothetical protein
MSPTLQMTASSSELAELSCRLRVPAGSVYASLLRYLKEHPYHTISDFLLDAAAAFYLPLSLLESSNVAAISTEELHRYGCQSVSSLTAQTALIISRLNSQFPASLQIQTQLEESPMQLMIPAQEAETTHLAKSSSGSLLNPFSTANFSTLK